MRVLVGCEFSGIVRDAFRRRGHNAWSCDLLPTERRGPHIQCDVRKVLHWKWDLVIFHPPCTYLSNAGVCWLKDNPGRQHQMELAREFFMLLYSLDIPRICVENPVPHGYAKLPPYTQIIQPWMFGHERTKATCLWLKGLPKLEPTNVVGKGERYFLNGKSWGDKEHMCMAPKDRAKNRSRTFQGIAEAMAEQWG